MKNKAITFVGIIMLACVFIACGTKQTGNTPLPTAEPTAEKDVAKTPEATATLVPTGVPEATETPVPTEVPEATETPVPTEVPEATETPVPTEVPEATETPTVPEVPKMTATPVPVATPEPTATPKPTATPTPTLRPTATPVPTPKPGSEVTVRFFAPLILTDLSAIEAKDAMELLSKLSAYAWSDMGTATETAMLNETASTYFQSAEESLMKNGAVKVSAEQFFDSEVTVSCNGWYDYNKLNEGDAGSAPKSEYYSNYNGKTFEELGLQKGEELEVFATYSVKTGSTTKAYVPCILDVQMKLGPFTTTTTYMMAMPIWDRVVLPEVEGYSLRWVDNGMTMSPDKIRIFDEVINHYTLVVEMEF